MIDKITDADNVAVEVLGQLDALVAGADRGHGPATACCVLAHLIAELHLLKPDYPRAEAEVFARMVRPLINGMEPEQALSVLTRVERRATEHWIELSA